MTTLALDITLARPGFSLRVDQRLTLDGITALFGPSGSGKTTLLRIVAGLERQASGTLELDGETWQDEATFVAPHRRRIGYVFQDGRLFPHLTVEGNLRFAVDHASSPSSLSLDETVEALELAELRNRRPLTLSGGEQQRVAIARALLSGPRLLLMDEPLSALDIARKREILPLIERLPTQFGVPVLYVTHNLDEMARLATNVLLLADGRVAGYDSVANVFERTDLLSSVGSAEGGVVLTVRVVDHRDGVATLALGSQQLRTPLGAPSLGTTRRIRIHARDVAIATERPHNLSIRNVLAARIVSIEAGANMNVELLLDVEGARLRSRITRDAATELGLAPGQSVFALVKSVALENALFT